MILSSNNMKIDRVYSMFSLILLVGVIGVFDLSGSILGSEKLDGSGSNNYGLNSKIPIPTQNILEDYRATDITQQIIQNLGVARGSFLIDMQKIEYVQNYYVLTINELGTKRWFIYDLGPDGIPATTDDSSTLGGVVYRDTLIKETSYDPTNLKDKLFWVNESQNSNVSDPYNIEILSCDLPQCINRKREVIFTGSSSQPVSIVPSLSTNRLFVFAYDPSINIYTLYSCSISPGRTDSCNLGQPSMSIEINLRYSDVNGFKTIKDRGLMIFGPRLFGGNEKFFNVHNRFFTQIILHGFPDQQSLKLINSTSLALFTTPLYRVPTDLSIIDINTGVVTVLENITTPRQIISPSLIEDFNGKLISIYYKQSPVNGVYFKKQGLNENLIVQDFNYIGEDFFKPLNLLKDGSLFAKRRLGTHIKVLISNSKIV